MKQDRIEQTEPKVDLRTTGISSRSRASSCTAGPILLAVFLVILPALSRSAHASDVVLAWDANTEPVLAGYKLYYGTASRQYSTSIDVGNVISHTVTGLQAGIYYFAVTAYSSTEETGYSNEVSAVITAPDTTPPSNSGVTATGVTYSAASISWATDEPADTQLEYGLSGGYGCVTAVDPALAIAHAVALSGLSSSTTYHYRVRSKDAAGNLSVSGDFIFTTSAPPDTKPPLLTSIRSLSVSNNSATIAWTTDEPADTQVEHGQSTAYGTSTALISALVTSHSQSLSGLSPGSVYHFRVKSRDAAGNLAVSGDSTFTTTSLPDITSSLVAAYSFDEGTGDKAVDSSGGSNSAILNNAAWTSKAKYGKALSFNGKNSFVSAGVAGLPAVNAPKTISCWLNVSGGAGTTQSVIALANEAQHASVQQEFKSSQVGMLQYGDTWLVAGNSPPAKAWHHFAYTFDGTQNRFYIDGVLVSSSTIQPQAGSVAGFQIGRGIAGSDYFKGSIDEVRIYSRALSQEEITAVMNTAICGSQAGQSLSVAKMEIVGDDRELEGEAGVGSQDRLESGEDLAGAHDSRVAVDMRMSQRTYHIGDTVRTSASWLSNASSHDRIVELKTWLVAPGFAPIGVGEPGTDGSFVLPAGFDQDFGPLSLFEISADMPGGTYRLNARVIDPVTGDILHEDINPFTAEVGEEASRHNTTAKQRVEENPRVAIESHTSEFALDGRAELPGLRIANSGDTPATVELKVWIEAPGWRPIPVFVLGGEGSLVLPGGADLSLDRLAPSQPLERLTGGSYQLRSRILDPVTGQLFSETAGELVIR